MSSKIFKSAVSEGRLSIAEAPNRRFTVGIRRNGVATDMVDLAPSDAPALALAILEAAGVETVNHTVRGLGNPDWLEGIAHSLQLHIEHEAKLTAAAKAEAEEMAKLEAEALDLYNARILFLGGEALTSFEKLNQDSKGMWLAVARRAREINKEEK